MQSGRCAGLGALAIVGLAPAKAPQATHFGSRSGQPPHAHPPLSTAQCLDLKNMQVISQVLAQSVAMDFYSRWEAAPASVCICAFVGVGGTAVPCRMARAGAAWASSRRDSGCVLAKAHGGPARSRQR
jgi:hypothetical protein